MKSNAERINAGRGYWMRPMLRPRVAYCPDSRPSGGEFRFGPLQANWGFGNGAMPKGLRVYLTWPGRTRTLIDAWR